MTWEEFIDTPLSNLADQITALSGDNVPPLDDTQRLLSALRRAGFLDKHETMRLQALYLNRKPETWQQMAERLGVEMGRQMVRDGEQFFQKSDSGKWIRVWVGKPSEAPFIHVAQQSFSEPQDIRDLSACLQVAARYLEEVEQ